MKKDLIAVFIVFLAVCSFNQVVYCQTSRDIGLPDQSRDLLKGFIQEMTKAISSQAADMVFDYTKRPVMGVLVANFPSASGREIDLGNEIASELRTSLNKSKQFYVYGKEDSVSQALKTIMLSDLQFGTTSQRKFQNDLKGLEKFRSTPVDLIITGQIIQENNNQLKIIVNLIPFYRLIRVVETESDRTAILKQQFISPKLSLEMVAKALTPIEPLKTGRLVIVSLLNIDQDRKTQRIDRPSSGVKSMKNDLPSLENTWKINSPTDISCWLGDNELKMKEAKDWGDLKRKEYQVFLSEIGADMIWFDDWKQEGTYTFLLSLTKDSFKNKYQTFSRSFSIKGGAFNYLYFSIQKDSSGEPYLRIQQIIDPRYSS